MITVEFDPVLFSLGPLEVRWYGLMYVLGYFVGGKVLLRLSKTGFLKVDKEGIDSFIFYLIIGMFLGARTFYVFIYNWGYYQNHITELFAVWKGGLSFHGAVVGMCLATYIFTKKRNMHFFEVGDAMAVAGAPGLFFGRMGNFINGELYGRVTNSPFGMIFPEGGPNPRHPSQLYEGISEGIILFIILYIVHKKQKNYGMVSAVFLAGYGIARYMVEFFREPDAQLGYYFNGTTTMGQILCLLMVLGSFVLVFLSKKANVKNSLHT
jgi:phosphatidylglycerol:prolipoprotein diacylglycerol transferase